MSSAVSKDQEFLFTNDDFIRVQRIVYDYAGINLTDAKRNLVYNRLSKRVRLLGYDNYGDYLDHVEAVGEQEFVLLINSITTNLTFFFREIHHFEYLAQDIVPALLKNNASKKIRVWSAGCSTGEEPYSIAITLKESVPDDWDVKLIASDLDSNVLATAQAGIYDVERLKGMTEAQTKRWFQKGTNHNAGKVKAKDELKQIIEFQQINLMQNWPLTESFDVIFCRNVVIYFDKPTQRRLFSRYADQLKPKGHLIIGHSESLYEISDQFKLLGKTIYQKVD